MRKKKRKKILRNIDFQKESLKKTQPKLSEDSLAIINFWIRESKKCKNMVTHSLDSKTIFKLGLWLDKYPLKVKNGSYKKYKVSHIKRSIKIFRKMINSGIIDLPKSFSIKDFLRGKSIYIKKEHRIIFKEPYYYKLIADRDRLRAYLRSRGNPEWYKIANKRLKDFYKQLVLDEKRIKFSKKQEEQFALASKRLIRYMIGNNKLDYLDYERGATLDDFIRVMISSLRWHYKKKSFGIGHLCSNYTFTEILPKYINFHKPR